MAGEKKPAGSILRKILLGIVIGSGIFLCLTGMIIAFVVIADHMSEFFNGWNYKNDWEPFRGSYIDYVRQIPHEVYIAFGWYPEACFITLIFYPMLALLVAVYEVTYSDYTLVLYGWLPFLTGIFEMVFLGFMLLREPESPHAGKYKF